MKKERIVLCYSSIELDCLSNRGQISKGRVRSPELYIKKDQFMAYLFITVQCQTTKGCCSYNITISKKNETVIYH